MEDATIGGLCTSIAEQVLLPDAGAETNSAVSIQRSSDLIIAPATRRALMREVAERAVLLYRLAQRRSGCGVPISPEGSGPHDAAFCVGAAIMELLPALWSSLSRRASLLRPRLPCLRLGSPAPWPIAVREVAKFFARTRHLLGAPTPKPGPPRQELVEAQVECLAVLYFSTVTTAAEQRRHPQLMEVVTHQSSSNTAPGHKRSRPIAESLTVFAADLVEGEEEEDEDDGEASGPHQGAARTMDLRLGEEGVGTAPPTLWTTLATAEQQKEDRCASGTTSSLLPACGSVNWLQLCAEAELAKSLLYWQHLEECLRCPLHFAKLESSPPAAVVFETQPFDHLPTPSRPAIASREAQWRTATVAAPLRWSSTSTEGWRTNEPGDDPTRVQFFHPTHFLREAASAQTRVVDPALFVQTTSAATGVSTMVGSLSSLLPGPTQQITQHYLWWRLLVSGLWMLLYICQGQPTLPDGKAGSCITPQRSSCGDGPATSGGPCGRREGEDYEHLSRTVACCVRVVKEARNYRVGGEEVRCPVCDRLRRDDRQAIYWPALRGDRGALYHQMQPFYGHCAVSSIIAEQRSTNGRAMSPDVDAPDESRQVLSEEEETLRKWWDAFHDKGVGEASNLETDVPLGETRAVLIRILARRLHAAVMLAVAAASSSKAVRRPAPADDAPDPTTSDSASSTVRAPVGVAEVEDTAHNAYGWVAEGRGRGGGSQAPSRRLRLTEIRRLSLRALLERVVLDSRDAAEVARVLLPPSTTPSPEISAQVEKLLDFVPAIPPVREEDAVVECARCYSIFHQGCIAPMQRDMHGGVFLCHTCRLTCPGA